MTKTAKPAWTAPVLNKLGTIADVAAKGNVVTQVGNSAKS